MIEDRKIGAMELLLSTPLSVHQILRGQRLALLRQFGMPVLVMLVTDLSMMVAGLSHSDLNGQSQRTFWLWMWLAGIVMFAADAVALYWVGMWTGLAVRNPRHAFGAALVPVLALPWLGVGVAMTIFALLPYQMQQPFHWDGWPLLLWFGLGVVVDLVLGLAARANLLKDFRLVAAQRYQPKPSWRQRWFGKAAH
jgi:hypothetical protein